MGRPATAQPDDTNPIGRRPRNTLSGFKLIGEEFTVPRKLRPDTFMTTACILPDITREIEKRLPIRSGSSPELSADPPLRSGMREHAAARQLI
jgi:hypothetical protein